METENEADTRALLARSSWCIMMMISKEDKFSSVDACRTFTSLSSVLGRLYNSHISLCLLTPLNHVGRLEHSWSLDRTVDIKRRLQLLAPLAVSVVVHMSRCHNIVNARQSRL